MPTLSTCPGEPTLEKLRQGQLSLVEVEEVARHLETCERCAARVQHLHLDEALLADVAAQACRTEAAPEPVVQQLMEKLRGLHSASASGSTVGPLESVEGQEAAEDAAAEMRAALAPPQQPDELGRLGPYRILSVLGQGGMGLVYRAEDPRLRRQIALKVMLPRYAANANARERFTREAQAQAAIDHEHIITIFEVNEDNGVPYLAMPLLHGCPLQQTLRQGPLPLSEVLRIGREIAEGLAAAHARGLIHRDIKPGNVWLEERNSSPPTPFPQGERGENTSLPPGGGGKVGGIRARQDPRFRSGSR